MATEKYIDEQIENLQKQLEEDRREKQQRKKQTFDERGKFIDEQLEALQRQIREEEKKRTVEHFSREEKKLLSKIESKHSIIQFLSNSLESEEKKLKDLEEELELLRDCKICINKI